MAYHKYLILLTFSGLFLVSCGPQKKEETQPEVPQKQEVAPQPSQPTDGTLTPQQELELKIEEENVMEPFPG